MLHALHMHSTSPVHVHCCRTQQHSSLVWFRWSILTPVHTITSTSKAYAEPVYCGFDYNMHDVKLLYVHLASKGAAMHDIAVYGPEQVYLCCGHDIPSHCCCYHLYHAYLQYGSMHTRHHILVSTQCPMLCIVLRIGIYQHGIPILSMPLIDYCALQPTLDVCRPLVGAAFHDKLLGYLQEVCLLLLLCIACC